VKWIPGDTVCFVEKLDFIDHRFRGAATHFRALQERIGTVAAAKTAAPFGFHADTFHIFINGEVGAGIKQIAVGHHVIQHIIITHRWDDQDRFVFAVAEPWEVGRVIEIFQ
jgi:hypothetical protein